MPRIDDVLAYLSEFQVDNLTPKGRNLFYLECSLAEIGPAVELFGPARSPSRL